MEKSAKKHFLSALLSIFLVALLMVGILPVQSSAAYNDELDFQSDIVYMVNMDQGTVIFNKNSSKKTAMASLTKITTCLLVLENVSDLDTEVTVRQEVLDTLAGTNSSLANLQVGEVLTVNQLLNLMMVHSGNDAAAVLADYVGGGSISKFVEMMNARAKELGCKNTHYTNPHGLDDDNHYSTAEDLAILATKALEYDTFKSMVSQSSYTLAQTNKRKSVTYSNTNYLLSRYSGYYYEPCKGIKTGTTENAGQCLLSYATQNGYTYLTVIIGGKDLYSSTSHEINIAFNETVKAYKWVFSHIKLKVVADPNTIVTVAKVSMARKVDSVQLVPASEVTALLPSDVDSSGVSIEVVEGSIDSNLHAPLKAGDKVGKANVLYAGDVLCTIDLVAATDVRRSFFGSIGYFFKTLFGFTATKVLLGIAAVALLGYLLVNALYKKRLRTQSIRMVRAKPDLKGAQPIRPVSDQRYHTKQPRQKRKKSKSGRAGSSARTSFSSTYRSSADYRNRGHHNK